MLRRKIPFGCRDVTDAEWQDIHLSCWDMFGDLTEDDYYVAASGDKYFGIGCCLIPVDESWKPLCCMGNYSVSVEDKMCNYVLRLGVFNNVDRRWYMDRPITSERQLMGIIKTVYMVDSRSDKEIFFRVRDALLRYIECTQPLLDGIPEFCWVYSIGKKLPLRDTLDIIYRIACGKFFVQGRGTMPSNYELLRSYVMGYTFGLSGGN